MFLAGIEGKLTIIMELKEAAGAEVTVKLDEDLISCGGQTFLQWCATELADLRRSLVGSIPDMVIQICQEWWTESKSRDDFWINSSWDQRAGLFIPKRPCRISRLPTVWEKVSQAEVCYRLLIDGKAIKCPHTPFSHDAYWWRKENINWTFKKKFF